MILDDPLQRRFEQLKLKYGREALSKILTNLLNERILKMREITEGTQRFTKIQVLDEPGHGGACHHYVVTEAAISGHGMGADFATIRFQNGPVKEHGINGCHQEDLLAVVIDRLRSFQAGPFACRENALALTKIEEAMHWLNHRTSDRQKRGVEGTNKE